MTYFVANKNRLLTLVCLLLFNSASLCFGQITEWIGVPGDTWSDPASWTAGVPTNIHTARIGILESAHDELLYLESNTVVDSLEVSDAVALYMDGYDLLAISNTLLNDPAFGAIAAEIRVQGGTFATNDLDIVSGWFRLSDNATAIILGELWITDEIDSVGSVGELFGSGMVTLTKDNGIALRNDGTISANSAGLTIAQLGDGLIDLDGFSGEGIVNLFLFADEQHLIVSGTELADPFSGRVISANGAILDMDLEAGWIADVTSRIEFQGTDNQNPGRIQGSHLTLDGTLEVDSNSQYPALARVDSDIDITNTAIVEVDENAVLEFAGQTNIDDAEFNLAQQSDLFFLGETVVKDGTFTVIEEPFLGLIRFEGPTTYSGSIQFNGVVNQIGNATVNLPTVITADTYDFDGNGMTAWEINNSLIFNVDTIESAFGNTIDGSIDVGGAATAKLTINFNEPTAWNMAGQMTLTNNLPFQSTRLEGAPWNLGSELFVNGSNVRVVADTDFLGTSTTYFQDDQSSLVIRGRSTVQDNANFLGGGTLINHALGQMTIDDGASLNETGLQNNGLLKIDQSAGIADVAQFENSTTGRWLVDVGGHISGDEFDVLLSGNGPIDIDGMLIIKLIDAGNGNFHPTVGDEFTIATSVGGVNGQFANVPISILEGTGYEWEVFYNSNDITIRVADVIPNTFLGDINQDGSVDLLDVAPFIVAIEDGEYDVFADVNCDGQVDLLDVDAFVTLLSS